MCLEAQARALTVQMSLLKNAINSEKIVVALTQLRRAHRELSRHRPSPPDTTQQGVVSGDRCNLPVELPRVEVTGVLERQRLRNNPHCANVPRGSCARRVAGVTDVHEPWER